MADRQAPEAGKRDRRQLVAASTTVAGVALAAVLLGLVNYFGWKYHKRFDWTATALYSLSEQSKNVVRALDRDVDAVLFTSPEARLAEPVEEILERYAAESSRFTVRVVDPIKNLIEAERLLEQYETRYVEGSVKVVLDAGGERRLFEQDDFVDIDYSSLQTGGAPEIESFKGEEVLTGALMEMVSGEQRKVLFTTGHGEYPLDDFSGAGLQGAQELLGRGNLELESWSPLGAARVPEGTDLVVIAGPTASFVEPELAVLDEYLAGGGRLLLLVDPTLSPDGGLVDLGLGDWIAGYGVELGDDIVLDPDRAVPFYGAETAFFESFTDHPVTQALYDAELQVILPLARSVREAAGGTGDYTVTELMRTGASGWGERQLDALDAVARGDDDLAGPVSVAVAVEGPPGDDGAGEAEVEGAPAAGEDEAVASPAPAATPAAVGGLRMVVIGDSDFAGDRLIGTVAHAALLDNAFNWLLERESFLGIPPKKPEQVRLDLDSGEVLTVYGLTALLPLLAIVAGVVVYLKRRR